MNGRMAVWVGGWIDERMGDMLMDEHGYLDGRMDGWTDGHKLYVSVNG